MRRAAEVASVLVFVGCGAASIPAPEGALRAYAEAVHAGDADRAYGFLSAEARQKIPRDAFRRAFAENRAEVRQTGADLGRVVDGRRPVPVEVPLPTGGVAVVVCEGGGWRVASGLAGATSLETPEQALVALRAALAGRNYGALLRVLSRRLRGSLDDEVRRMVDALDDPRRLPVHIDGNRARVTYAPGRELRLVFEDGEWRVDDAE